MPLAATFAPTLFAGKFAVVTGGASGIGAATALLLARLGARVLALGLGADGLQAPRHERIERRELDLRERDAAADALDALPELDVLVNAAGISLDRDEYERAISTP
jgi:NAD(P)-dependent dehydrogenase (short-subunit alcohol dehydrogenase family)